MRNGKKDYKQEREPLISHGDCDGDRATNPTPTFTLTALAKYCLLLEFFLELSNNISTVPLISIYHEQAICDRYYQNDPAHVIGAFQGDRCKIAPIQSELARVRGWKGFFETCIGNSLYLRSTQELRLIEEAMVVALPVGHLADRFSHRKVYAIILTGMVAGVLWTTIVGRTTE